MRGLSRALPISRVRRRRSRRPYCNTCRSSALLRTAQRFPTITSIRPQARSATSWRTWNGGTSSTAGRTVTPSASPTTIPPTVSGSSLAGRWGENVTRLDPNVNLVLAGTVVPAGLPTTGDPWPLPGTSGVDDNGNSPEAGVFRDEQSILHPAFVHPLDFFSTGLWFANTEGKTRALLQQGQQKYPQYSNYFTNRSPGPACSGRRAHLAAKPCDRRPATLGRRAGRNVYRAVRSGDATQRQHLRRRRKHATAPRNRLAIVWQLGAFGEPGVVQPFGQCPRGSDPPALDFHKLGLEVVRQRVLTPPAVSRPALGKSAHDARRLWEFTDLSGASPPVGPYRFPPNFGTIAPPPPPYTLATNYPLRTAIANLL